MLKYKPKVKAQDYSRLDLLELMDPGGFFAQCF
jgi:hypothetical protein